MSVVFGISLSRDHTIILILLDGAIEWVLFIEVNKRKKLLSVSNIMKEKSVEKEYKRKVPMKELTFYHTLIEFIYDTYNLSAA